MSPEQSSGELSGVTIPLRPYGMSTKRRFKFDRGDWIAVRNAQGEWVLGGKVVDADSESVCVERRGVRSVYVPGEDAIAHIRWIGGGRWKLR